MIKKSYEKYLLPKLLDCCCSTKPINYQRNKVVPNANGNVLEIGIGSGLNLPFYEKSKINNLYGIDPSSELCDMAKKKASDNEIDVKYLKQYEWYEIKPGVHKVIRGEGDYLILLAEGRLANLALATGHPSRVMDGSFCNQVLAQIFLYKDKFADLSKEEKLKKVSVKVLPKYLDEEVAYLMVKGFGGTLTKLTKEQADYIGVEQEGPFKEDSYNY